MPEVGPDGLDGIVGGWFNLSATIYDGLGFDQIESVPCSSVALARTLKVSLVPGGIVQIWDALADAPELTRDVIDVVPSPQSNVYFTLSPSGSVAFVE